MGTDSTKTSSSPEQLLWLQFQQGDTDALSPIYSRYFDQLYNYGVKFVSDPGLVEDCIQDLFVKLIRNRKNLAAPDSLKAYLFASLRSHLFDKLERSKKFAAEQLNEFGEFSAELSQEPGIILSEEERAKQQQLRSAIANLTPRQREAVFLKYHEGLSYPEIAGILSLTQKATYKLIGRAIQSLRSVMSLSVGAAGLIILLLKLLW